MAVALEGFSIREYAASMRSVDLDKCSPFPADGKSIPEMSVRKFRFWYDELRSIPTTPTMAACDEIPSVKTPSKPKQRTPKKRSIVELFAVAPPIETDDANDEEDKEEDEEEEEEVKGKDVVMEDFVEKRKVMEKVSGKKLKTTDNKERKMMKKKRLMSGKIVKKKKKKKLKVEICAAKKGSTSKISSAKNKKNTVDSRNQNKPTCIRNLPDNCNLKLLQSSKLNSMKRRGEGKHLSVHSILKAPTKGAAKKAGAKKDIQGGNLIDFYCESAKRVTFSGKDDILGHGKSRSTIDIPQLQNLCKIFSDVLAASSAMNNQQKDNKVPANTDETHGVAVSDMNVAADITETGDGTISGNEQSIDSCTQVLPPTYTYPNNESSSNKGRCSFTVSLDQNHPSNSDNALRAPTSSAANTHLGDQRILESVQSDQFRYHAEVDENETSARTTDTPTVFTSTGKCSSRSDACSLSFIGNPSTSQPISCSKMPVEENGKYAQPLVESVTDPRLRVTEFQPVHRLPSKASEEGWHSLGSGPLSHPAPTYKDRYPTEGFVGLPLNSQGELIKFHSGAKFGFSESSKRQNAAQGSVFSYHVPDNSSSINIVDHNNVLKGKFPGVTLNQADGTNWLQNQYGHVCKPVVSGSSFSTLQGIQRFEAPINGLIRGHQESNVRQVSYSRCREDNRTRNYIDRVNFHSEGSVDHVSQPNSQQTMRLMGKDVTVGQSNRSCHGYEDGRMWTDKEVVTDYPPSIRVSDRPIPQQWSQKQWFVHPASAASKGSFFQSPDASSQKFRVPAVEPKSGLMHVNYQPQWISRNRASSNTASHPTPELFNHRFPSQIQLNESARPSLNSNTMMTSVRLGLQFPMMASSSPTTYQHAHVLPNPSNCQHNQGISYTMSTVSNFNPPFLYQDTRNSFQPSPSHSSPNIPQWLLSAEQNRKGQGSSSLSSSNSDLNSLSRTDNFHLSSPFPTSMISFPYCANDKSSSTPLPPHVVKSSPVPVRQSNNKSVPAVNHVSRSKNENKEAGNVNFTYLKSSSLTTGKNKKRPAATDDGFMKPAKKPFLRVHEDAGASTTLRQNKQVETRTPSNDKIVNENISEMLKEKEAIRTVILTSSSKVNSGSKLGPVKLSAGAKHIIKLSQAADSKPIHSTVPFSTANASGKLVDPQMKAAEVYRF